MASITEQIVSLATALGATASGNYTISSAIDLLADTLAGSDQSQQATIAAALGELSGKIAKVPSGTISITENGEGIDVAAYATADVSVSGGGGDFSTATVAVSLTMPEGKTLAEAVAQASVGYYNADFLPIVDGEAEVWLVQGYTTHINTILGTDTHLYSYILDTSSPITATGGVSWDGDNECFTVTGDGTISASLYLGDTPK